MFKHNSNYHQLFPRSPTRHQQSNLHWGSGGSYSTNSLIFQSSEVTKYGDYDVVKYL